MGETLRGIGVSPGIAIGPAYLVPDPAPMALAAVSPGGEHAALERSISAGIEQLEAIAARLRGQGREEEAGIMDAQALMLADPSLLDMVRREIDGGASAARATQNATAHFKAKLEGLDDPYLADRAADVQDVADRVCRNLQPEDTQALPRGVPGPPLDRPSVMVARDLAPSYTASLDRSLALGLATDAGGPTSHTAILARALNIPAVVGLSDLTCRIQNGQILALDGESGTVIVEPDPAALAAHRQRARDRQQRTIDLAQYTLAVDRVNERVASLYRPLHPAILRLLERTVSAAHARGKWAGICGELGGDPVAIPILLGLGFDELSMTPSRIPAAKELIRRLEHSTCLDLAAQALSCASPQEVERLTLQIATLCQISEERA